MATNDTSAGKTLYGMAQQSARPRQARTYVSQPDLMTSGEIYPAPVPQPTVVRQPPHAAPQDAFAPRARPVTNHGAYLQHQGQAAWPMQPPATQTNARARGPAKTPSIWRLEIVAAVVILAGFMVSIVVSSSSNGQTTSYIDYGAIIAGLAAIPMAGLSFSRRRRVPYNLAHAKIAAAASIFVLGCIHIARGLGAFV